MKFLLLLFVLMGYAHDLHLTVIPGTGSRTMICCHGYGANYQIAEAVKSSGLVDATLVSFNFLDHDELDLSKTSFGTTKELLPALSVLKKCVLKDGLKAVDLYGFSAGGGAVINLIAALQKNTFALGKKENEKLLSAIQKGVVILDVPLKSMEEIIDQRGSSAELELVAQNYRKNHCRPIDTLDSLKGLGLNVLLYFENPDEIIFNRDDEIFIEKLKKVGNVCVIKGSTEGHNVLHMPLWEYYAQNFNSNH